jgi:hypothetical protein
MASSVEGVGGIVGVSEGSVASAVFVATGLGVRGAGVSGGGELQARRIRVPRKSEARRRIRDAFMRSFIVLHLTTAIVFHDV